MRWRLAVALTTAAIVATACGGGTGDDGSPAASPAPVAEDAPSTTTQAPAPTTTDPPPTSAAPEPTTSVPASGDGETTGSSPEPDPARDVPPATESPPGTPDTAERTAGDNDPSIDQPEPDPARDVPPATESPPGTPDTAERTAGDNDPSIDQPEPDPPIAGSDSGTDGDAPPPATSPAGGTPAAGGLGDSFYAQLGNAGYDVVHYDIDLDVDPASNTIAAVTTITALAEQDMSAFNLDLSGLEVHDVTVDGIAAEFSRSGSELTVQPGLALAQGEEFSVSVDYSGTPEPIHDPGVPFTALGWHWRDGVVFTVSQPSGAMTWFPSNNHPSDKATFEIRITVPTAITAAATGLLVDESTTAGRTTTTWRMDDPMATYLTAVYIGDFDRVDHGRPDPAGPLLRDYVPGGAAPEVVEALAVTSQVIAFIEEILGPYPFEAYGTIVLPYDLGFALENQTLSVHGRDILDAGIIAHEVAHQWLGNSVALEEWDDMWLNEGFVTYLHLMFAAEHYGYDFGAEMRRVHEQLPFFAGTPPKGITIEELVGPSVYFRGAMTLHALRLHAGDETFFQMLRTHYDRSAGGTTNTEEFLGIVDEFAGTEAVALVQSWLYDETVPDLPEPRPAEAA